MHYRKLSEFFEVRRERGDALALASVFATSGSTYSKAGARMLIDGAGVFRGMLSGGCLEGDLAIRAQQVIQTGQPQRVGYNLADDDELWGLGVGCDGSMEVFVQPLSAADAWEPYATIAALEGGTRAGAIATVIASGDTATRVGGWLALGEETQAAGLGAGVADVIAAHAARTRETRAPAVERHRGDGGEIEVFYSPLTPIPRILVLGAGPDAVPVVRFANELGWRVTVADHRPAYLDGSDFSGAERVLSCPAGEIASTLELARFDMAVVMSHHLASDRDYLRQLAATDIAYIGLLGPASRRERLLADLGAGAELGRRVHGPAGLDLGGRGPAAIALSIVAGMQRALSAGTVSRAAVRAGSSG